MTIKTGYVPGKLWGGSCSHCVVVILMFLTAPRLKPDSCFPIATIRTCKITKYITGNKSILQRHEKIGYATPTTSYLKILTWFEWHLSCQPGLALVTMETPQRDIFWWCQQFKSYWWSRIMSGKIIREGQAQPRFFINKIFWNPWAL